ncbi:hypothetical protein BT96DRAFT_167887 [Gymnopus androsaceus JB14]|uniref:Uncharacterized protein n=1 Tax=Gymnopus androsaceus JB14 TaxID=1447944 RepID=A0A6A4HCD9_9AGAR|nr:hypothetical protein BT96DRAFT_167887 [Gymnopus androsaceus JB14]
MENCQLYFPLCTMIYLYMRRYFVRNIPRFTRLLNDIQILPDKNPAEKKRSEQMTNARILRGPCRTNPLPIESHPTRTDPKVTVNGATAKSFSFFLSFSSDIRQEGSIHYHCSITRRLQISLIPALHDVGESFLISLCRLFRPSYPAFTFTELGRSQYIL